MSLNYSVLLPETILALTGVLVMLYSAFRPLGRDQAAAWLGSAGLAAAAGAIFIPAAGPTEGFFGMVVRDPFADFSRLLFLFAAGAVLLLASSYLGRDDLGRGDFTALLLFSTVGMCLMAASADLMMTFLGIELLSISSYVLAGYRRGGRSAESAWKYFILGAFSTAFLLYGIAFIYGVTGSTRYAQIAAALDGADASLALLLALVLLVVGFGFKAALVPFHVWTPDVYEGAPIPVTALLAVGSKAVAFLAFLRLLEQVLPELAPQWQPLLWASAALTMILGNLAALTQTNIKRMLAYSSIAHAGYLLVGVTAHNQTGSGAVLFYLAAYALMTLGAFSVVQILGRKEERLVELDDYRGAGHHHPFLGISLAVFLISMAGIPATAGFMGKFFLFSAAVRGEMFLLVVLGLLASAAGVYYYLRVIVLMFMHEYEGEPAEIAVSLPVRITLTVMLIGTLWFGLFPGLLLDWVTEATRF